LAGDISEYLGPEALTAIARGLVEDAPGWEYADVLPRAVNRETGQRSWAVPGMARDVAKGLWELMQGPYMEPGQNLSPEAVLSLPALAVPAGAALAPKGAIGMFAGRNAKTADLVALQRAEDMAAGGADNEAIRAATGWFRGPDEKWRFEIPDNAARMTGMSDFPASLVMEHDDLFRAYPELRDMPVESGRPPGGGRGAYDDGRKTITLAPDMDDPQARVTMLHELQHAIQSREGFAPGSSPTKAVIGESRPHFMRLYNERLNAITTPGTLEDFAKQAGLDNLDEARPFYDEYVKSVEDMRRKGVPPRIDRMAQETAQDQTYKRTAGEVEARDVQSRADFAPDQRAATAPYSSQGIAPEDIIVLNRGGGVVQSSMGDDWYHGTRATFDQFDTPEVYLTRNPAEAEAYARGVHLGGRGSGEPTVLRVQAGDGRVRNIDDVIMEGMMDDLDPDDIIRGQAAMARQDGVSFLEFFHPSATGGDDDLVRVAVNPKTLRILPRD
jgi:hypothetical protein